MKNIKVVIGANFGDEGKGLTTDSFVHSFPESKKVLNVRFSGGANAGHTVETKDGKKHVFGHFGSGSFNKNCITLLTSDFILNPILFRKEYESLEKIGIEPVVLVDKKCFYTTPFEMLSNQIIEDGRAENRHGSCGVGINSTVVRYNSISNKRFQSIECLRNINKNKMHLSNKDIESMYKTILLRFKNYNIKEVFNQHSTFTVPINIEKMRLFNSENILNNFILDIKFMLSKIRIVDELEIIRQSDNIVFEGSQGLLLDQNNTEYAPNLTTANTGIKNVDKLLDNAIDDFSQVDLEVCYVTRTYLTRHGNGKFKTECDKNKINNDMHDSTNHTNEYQGNFRYGFIDLNELCKRITADLKQSNLNKKVSLVITHLNETNNSFVEENQRMNVFFTVFPSYVESFYVSYNKCGNLISCKNRKKENHEV